MSVSLILCQRSPRLSSVIFIIFVLFYSMAVISTYLSSGSLIHFFFSSAWYNLLLILPCVFFISVIVLLISVLVFSFLYLSLNTSFIFWVCVSILFLRPWIIFTINIQHYFSGILPISTSFSCSSEVLSYYIIWNIIFMQFNFVSFSVCGLLSTGCETSSCSWFLPPASEVILGACSGFVLWRTSACSLLGWAWSYLSGGQEYVKRCIDHLVMSVCSLLVCCWKRMFAMTSVFSWQHSINLCPASFCTPRSNLPVTPGVSWLPTFAFQSP